MMETRCLVRSHGRMNWVLLEVVDRSLHVVDQQRTEIAADTVTYQNPLHREILDIGGQGIGGHLPAATPQPIREVVEAESRVSAVFHFPAQRRNAALHVAVVNDLERPQFSDFTVYVFRGLVARCMNLSLHFLHQTEEIVVLTNNRPARS